MSYLARLAAQASGSAAPPHALRPTPSFLRPRAAPAPAPWAGEIALEIEAESRAEIDGAAPIAAAPVAAPAQAQAPVAPAKRPATGRGAASQRGAASHRPDTEVADAPAAAPTGAGTVPAPPGENAAVAISTLLEPAPEPAASASSAAAPPVAAAGREAGGRERETDPRIAEPATPLASASARLASPPPDARAPVPSAAAAAVGTGSEPAGPAVVTVTIDRIDVIAPPHAAPARPALAPRPAPTLSLDAYLASRSHR